MIDAARHRQAHYIRHELPQGRVSRERAKRRGESLSCSGRHPGSTMNTLQTISLVANALVSIVVIVVLIAALPAIWSLRSTFVRLQERVDKLQTDLGPLIQHATTIADNVREASTTIKADVSEVSVTVRQANQRVRQALAITEQRLNEFNAFLRLVQEEGEDLFFSAASAVRGVRMGAAAFRRGRKRRGMDLASVEPDETEPADDYDQQEEEEDDGRSEQHAEAPRAPRIRPRRTPGRQADRGSGS